MAQTATSEGSATGVAGGEATLAGSGSVEGSAVRDAGAAYNRVFGLMSDVSVKSPSKVGFAKGTAGVSLGGAGAGFGLPLIGWGIRPEDAELKLGGFYLDIRSLTAEVLISDNINQTQTNRKTGSISQLRLEFAAFFQLNEALRLGAGGSIVYLPFKNEIGIGGADSGIFDLQGSVRPQFLVELAYDISFGGWDARAYDTFGTFMEVDGIADSFDMFNRDPGTIQDIAGRYRYGLDYGRLPNDRQDIFERRGNRDLVYRNYAGVEFSRLLPTVTRSTFAFERSDTWSSARSGGHFSEERVLVSLRNEHENMRFKPYIRYLGRHTSTQSGISHEIVAGLSGPVTDYIDFLGEAGYAFPANSNASTELWTVAVKHTPRPGTVHGIIYTRYISYPNEDLTTSLEYRLDQQIGPYILASLGLSRNTYESIRGTSPDQEDRRAEGRLAFNVSPRTQITASASYIQYDLANIPGDPDAEAITVRLEASHQLTERMMLRLMYQYENRDYRSAGSSYAENLGVISLTRYF